MTNPIKGIDFPANWKIERFKNLVTRTKNRFTGIENLLSVYLEKGVIPFNEGGVDRVHNPSEDLSKYQKVNIGDFVMNNQQAWRGSVGISGYEGIVSPAYYVYKLSPQIDIQFAKHLLRSQLMVLQYDYVSGGVGNIQRNLDEDALNNVLVPVPPLEEQRRIADYLDNKLLSIERLIENKQELANKVDEYFDVAVKNEVLGKSGDVLVNCPPWATHVEADRELIELGRLVKIRGEKNDPIKVDQVLSLTAKRGVILYEDKGDIGNVASEDISRYSIVRKGDLVVNCMNIIIGSVGISNYEGVLSPVYYVLKPIDPNKINMEFLALHFRIREFQRQLIRIGYGILDHRMRIPWVNLKAEKIVIPSISIQNAVVGRISILEKARFSLQETIASSISALQAYKVSLISELVTGATSVPNKREEVNA